ncbi:hypothetical protein Tco_1386461 [Tanacetum coccineum]
MNESAKRHEENSNLIKEIRASTNAAVRNQGALIKTLEIQIGQMSRKKDLENSKLILKSRQASILFLSRLNNYCCDEKGSYGPQYLDAYSYGATHINGSIPQKEKDPRSFTLPCLSELAHTKLTVELADRTLKHPKGITENVLVGIERRRYQVDDLIPTIEEGEVVDKLMIKKVKTRNDNKMISKIIGYLSDFDRDKKTRIEYVYNLKFSCMIGFEFVHANFFPNLPINVMSKKFYNSIIKDKVEFSGRTELGNFSNVLVFIGNFYVVNDFTVVKDMDPYLDEGMREVVSPYGISSIIGTCSALTSDGILNVATPCGDAAMKDVSPFMVEETVEMECPVVNNLDVGPNQPLPMQEANATTGNTLGNPSYATAATGNTSGKKVNVRTLYTPEGNKIDVVVPVDSICAVSKRFANTTYGFFLGKKVAYHVVANYVRNTLGKYGIVRSMFRSSTGLFSFQFSSIDGLDAMLENGPWFIWNNLIILKKWHPDDNLLKEDVCTIPVWVKLIVLLLRPSARMGRSSYARVMIELRADVELKDNIIVAMPTITREGHYTCHIRVKYEWKPPRCSTCKVFGHIHEECLKNTGVGVKRTVMKPSQTPRGIAIADPVSKVVTDGLGNNGGKQSFATMFKKPSVSKVVRLSTMTSEEVPGVNVAIPLAEVEVISHRFENTLYGYFIGKRLAFPLVENYMKNAWAKFGLERSMLMNGFFFFQFSTREGMEQDTITSVPVWVKLHNVPIVAFSEVGLSIIAFELGKPIMLDAYTSTICQKSWGRNLYARVLIEVSSLVPLIESVVVVVPFLDGFGHSFETMEVEYEWQPPRCESCKISDHVDKDCPKRVKEVPIQADKDKDGFTTVARKHGKGKNKGEPRQVVGIKLAKSKLNLQYRPVGTTTTSSASVESGESSKSQPVHKSKSMNDDLNLSNAYASLENVEEDPWINATIHKVNFLNTINESDSEEVDEELVVEDNCYISNKGASTLITEGTRIILGWNGDVVDMNIISQTDQVLHVRVWIKSKRKEVFFSFIYVHNRYTHRQDLWHSLGMHKHFINDRPWCILGDFNAALNLEDTSASSFIMDISMREFNDCVDDIKLMDVPRAGLQFTWNQKPHGTDGILKKLNRVMANVAFSNGFVGNYAVFQPYGISDHSPAVLRIPLLNKFSPKPFKFFNVVSTFPWFMEVVKEGWGSHLSGFHMYKVVKKLKILKKPLRKLFYDQGNLHENMNKLHIKLEHLQTDLDSDPSNQVLREEEAAYVSAFTNALLMEEMFLKQKEKIEWLKVGDANTAYFHKSVKGRTSRNRIDVVTDIGGGLITGEGVPAAFMSHYEAFLGQTGITSLFDSHDLFMATLDSDKALDMIKHVSSQEDIVAEDVTRAIQEFFNNGKLLKELNHIILALLPKVKMPTRINDYRPISCCNVLFKCITKIISNRIKVSLKGLISQNQSAFVPGRRIYDNILLTQELMHNYHLDRGTPRCAFKIDIQKAYDTVGWKFLETVLLAFGFHIKMVAWIMECVSTTSFSLSINGTLHGYFRGKRGLRQGDPMSPYLFTLIMEVFTLMLRRKVRDSGDFVYHHHCDELEIINLCFADDLFIFAHGDPTSAMVIKEALEEFKNAFGLIPSLLKITSYFCNVLNHIKISILQILPFEEGRLPVKYLGVPLVSSRLVFHDCGELMDRIHSRIHNWKSKSLSAAGRLQLLLRNFLWSQGDASKGKAKVSWEVVCLPKNKGGLGVRLLDTFNKALMDIHNAGLLLSSKVKDAVHNGVWTWPIEWASKYPSLNSVVVPLLVDTDDKLEWYNKVGLSIPFSVSGVWNCIRPRADEVDWYNVVWFTNLLADLPNVIGSIVAIVGALIPIAKRRSIRSVIAKLVVAACAYHIWQERNARLFSNQKRSHIQVVECIKSSIRLKLLSCTFKKSKDALRDSYSDNDDYDPYDDDMYENHDLSEHLQSICDDLDITVYGRKKK